MKSLSVLFIVSTLGLSTFISNQVQAKDKWVCMKDGAKLEVKGKNAKDHQKDCESKGGIWEKSAHEDKQKSGSGGSW